MGIQMNKSKPATQTIEHDSGLSKGHEKYLSDRNDFDQQRYMQCCNSIKALEFSPDAIHFAFSYNHLIKIYDLALREQGDTLIGHKSQISQIKYSPDGQYLASVSGILEINQVNSIKLWNIKRKVYIQVHSGFRQPTRFIQFSTDGLLLISGSSRELKNFSWKVPQALITNVSQIRTTNQSVQRTQIVFGGIDTQIRIMNVQSQQKLSHIHGRVQKINQTIQSWKERLIIASQGKFIRIWNYISKYKLLRSLKGHEEDVITIALSINGTLIVSSSEDSRIRLWSIISGSSIVIMIKSILVNVVQFSRDDKFIITGDLSGQLIITPISQRMLELIIK